MSGKTKIVDSLLKLWFVAAWIFAASWIFSTDPNTRTVASSALVCGLTFLALRKKAQKTRRVSKKGFVFAGSLAAAYVETVFWLFEKLFGAQGVAAHPDLFVDLLITMPWYVVMVWLFWRVVNKHFFSEKEVFVLGGIYELAADGVVSGVLGGKTNPVLFLVSLPVVFPIFCVVYALIVLMPFKLFKKEDYVPVPSRGKTKYSLLPLLGLLPYVVLVLLIRS